MKQALRDMPHEYPQQIIPVSNSVLAAFRNTPRTIFVREQDRDLAYQDIALPIGEGQTISQPSLVAYMTELLQLHGPEIVLEIGTGSGFQAAILSHLATHVYTIERISALAKRAQKILKQLHYTNVTVIHGDGSVGLPRYAPYDAILVTAAAPAVPTALVTQLKQKGRLVLPVGNQNLQHIVSIQKVNDSLKSSTELTVNFVPLVGKQGWNTAFYNIW